MLPDSIKQHGDFGNWLFKNPNLNIVKGEKSTKLTFQTFSLTRIVNLTTSNGLILAKCEISPAQILFKIVISAFRTIKNDDLDNFAHSKFT